MPTQLSTSKKALDESVRLFDEIKSNSSNSANDIFALQYALDTRLDCTVNYFNNIKKYYECVKRLSALCLYDFANNIDYSDNPSWD